MKLIRKLQLSLLVCLLFSLTALSAQKEMRIADKQFDLQVYELAIESYKSVLKISPLDYHAMSRIAESYYRMNHVVEAASWYEKIVGLSNVDSKDILHYAHTLKKMGKYDEAKKYYLMYREADVQLAEHYAASCEAINDILTGETHFDISLSVVNSPASEFGASFFNGHLVFGSFNDQIKRRVYKRNKSHIHPNGNQLYVVDNTEESYQFLRPEIKEIFNIGPVAYDETGKHLAYTKNNFVDGRVTVSGDETELSIYTATVLNNGDFVNDKAFPFNSSLYANAFPFLMDDGHTMYFASNMLGGFGGFDLYVTHLVNGEWSIPENLGSQINTPGNEISPFVSDNKMYFASDYHFGLGGYDVFYSENSMGAWSFPQNMGKVINSSSDDYFLAINPANGNYYFSSNRIGGKGNDDIYVAVPRQLPEFAQTMNSEANMEELTPVAMLTSNVEKEKKAIKTPELKFEKMVDPKSNEVEVVVANATDKEGEMPKAVNLKALEKTSAPVEEASPVKMVSGEKAKGMAADNFFDLNSARKIAHGEVIKGMANVFFIQLASLSRSDGNFSRFKDFVKYGNIYKVYKGNTTKIRLGYFETRTEAMDVLMKIRKGGVKDAFLVYEPLMTSQLELIASNYTQDIYQEDNTFKPSVSYSNYKIRLASYTDPLWFDTESVADLGQIEQWTKGAWTIFVLSGYSSLEEAKQAQIKAINRGFTDAHVVIDNNGILEKLKEN